MKLLLSLFTLSFIASCSHHSNRTYVTKGEVNFNGGVHGSKSWTEVMKFNRHSWFSEITMEYDLMIHKLEKKSPFAVWMGTDKKLYNSCKEIYVGLVYANSYKDKTVSQVNSKLEELGLSQITLLNFEENIKAHKRYSENNLGQYNFFGYCAKSENSLSGKSIHFPGYQSTKLEK